MSTSLQLLGLEEGKKSIIFSEYSKEMSFATHLVLEDESGSINLKDPIVGDNAKIRKVVVYCMPLAAGISFARLTCQGMFETDSRFSPKIDPLNAYYVMNQTACDLDGFTCRARYIGTGRHSGKCYLVGDEILRASYVLLECISALVSRSTFNPDSSISFQLLAELIEKSIVGDMFAIEHATILYDICWIALKSFCTRKDENKCLAMSTIVSGVELCFIQSREVSWLLSVLYTFSSSNEAFSVLSSSTDVLSVSQRASYFHQASLERCLQKTTDVEGCCSSKSMLFSLTRLAPESVSDLEEFILKFFQGLPHVTIICISMLGDGFDGLLRELFPYNPCSPTQTWIMLSKLNSDSIPVVVLLTIDSILAGTTLLLMKWHRSSETFYTQIMQPYNTSRKMKTITGIYGGILRHS